MESSSQSIKFSRSLVALVVLTAASITAALYARSLALPFYSDDLVQLPWLRDLSFSALWTRVSPYGYYRPLAFSIWLVLRDLGLPWTPAGLRLLNLIGHIATASLTGWLAWKIDPERRSLSALLAAAFFAAYPFAYQAVPWVSAIFYPLVVLLMLLAVIAYLRARDTLSPRWLTVSLIAAALAPFAHENGVLVAPLVLLAEALRWQRTRALHPALRPSAWPLAHLTIAVLFLGVWFALREGGISTLDFSPLMLAQNAAILSIGWSFPVSWILQFGTIQAPPLLIGAVFIATVGLLLWLLRRSPAVLLFGLLWFALGIGPVLITMRPDWLVDAPRFLYPAGVGAALAWGIGLGGTRPISKMAAPAALLALLPSAVFVYQGVEWHIRGGAAIWDAVRSAQDHPDQALFMVNLPDRLAPERGMYPYFDGGAILLPPQVPVGDIAGAYTGSARSGDRAATVGEILPSLDFQHSTYGPLQSREAFSEQIAADTVVMIADYSDHPIRLREVGTIRIQPPQCSALANFEDSFLLWNASGVFEDRLLTLTLIWEMAAPPARAPAIFVHIVDGAGNLIAQADGDPLGGLYLLSPWQGHTYLADIRYIRLPDQTPFTVYVGLWEPATGDKLAIQGSDFPDDRVAVCAFIEEEIACPPE